MTIKADVSINKPEDAVWKAITDIENFETMISAIMKIHVLHKPSDSLIGLKWQETREMFGKQAMETMWITESVVNDYYCTRAESHGSIYLTKLSLKKNENNTLLSMSFKAIPQTNTAKILSFLLTPLIRKSIKNALMKDLHDIKMYLEKEPS